MGVQVVVTLLAASLMQKMAPHCSFARWLLCNGSLYRYKHPSDEELCALAGKQRPKSRRDRRASGVAEDKPLSVPRDIELQLDTSPITAVDALVLRHFLEYQWFVDFSVYAGAVYAFSEGYFCLVSPARESNLGVLWCLLTVLFSVKVFCVVMRHYFRSEEGGERSVCLTSAFFFLLLAMLALVVREDYLEFGLEAGFALGIPAFPQISRIYCYVSVVSLQYLGPVILTLHCALLLKTLGQHSWGLYPAVSPTVSPAAPVAPPRPEGGPGDTEDVQVVVQEISGLLGCIFTPPFFRGLFSFLTWWVAACQVVTSLFGLYFHQYLAAS
uniref:Transmembrane protein 161A n=1 Tax=Junco hyemalis TaxID=40217 RepID=A0A8C5INJ1_JUNHY